MGKNNSKDWRTLPPEYQWQFCAEGYLAHPDGTIKSVDRWVDDGKGGKRLLKGNVLKPRKGKDGYLQVVLYKDGKGKTYLVHRLVAEAFLDNPDSLPCINHISEIKTDNRVENLEFCSYQYNNTYGTRTERSTKKQRNDPSKSKTVYQYSLNGDFIREFPSTREVERQLGCRRDFIGKCCLGKKKTAYGYIWRYK